LSDQHLVHLTLPGANTLICDAQGMGHLEPGRAVGVELTRPLWFDSAGQRVTA
jgi:hypothetical protein